MKIFAVCIDEEYIRDVQILTQYPELPRDVEKGVAPNDDDCWEDADIQGFVGVYAAEDEHDALCRASTESGHCVDILRAIDVTSDVQPGTTGKHWVVFEEWCVDYENGTQVVAVCHSKDEAETVFATHRESYSRPDAERNHYDILTDSDDEFDAGKMGYYAQNHIYLRIIETDVKSEPVELRIRQVSASICDLFENLLATHGIMIPSNDRQGEPEEACIYGEPYSDLEDGVTDILASLLQKLTGSFIINTEEY